MNYLNLGCGSRICGGWTNVDFIASCPGVLKHDLRRGIPFPDNTFEVVYHSHALEHFDKSHAPIFLKECFRVLEKGGVLRIAVPDLEMIVRLYIGKLEAALQGSNEAAEDYHWMMLELFDQMVRTEAGGNAFAYLTQTGIPNENFVLSRWGVEAKKNIDRARNKSIAAKETPVPGLPDLIRRFYRLARYPEARRALAHSLRDAFLKRVLGSEWPLLELGRFRAGGSVHQWMYDRFSLTGILTELGFTQIVQRSADESYVEGWSKFNLDTEPDGSVYKPDSLYIEGVKS